MYVAIKNLLINSTRKLKLPANVIKPIKYRMGVGNGCLLGDGGRDKKESGMEVVPVW